MCDLTDISMQHPSQCGMVQDCATSSASARSSLRCEKIRAREALSPLERTDASAVISARVAASPEFRRARTVLLYRAVKGEVQLDVLAQAAEEAGKRVAYPRCISEGEMSALAPNGPDAWEAGRFGIMEPAVDRSTLVVPDEVDLVVCPCTAFDASRNRLGMGAGYYDRYLKRCADAAVVAVAFEVQRTAQVPVQSWDYPMDCVYTEEREYR